MKRIWSFMGLFLLSTLFNLASPWIPAQHVNAQSSGTVTLTINYDFGGIDDPEQYDDIAYYAFLLDDTGAVAEYTYTKLNSVDTNTAKALFLQVPAGDYQACLPQTPNLENLQVKCTDPFNLIGGQNVSLSMDLTSLETEKIILVAEKNDVNSKPCGGFNIGWILCQGINSMHDALNTMYLAVFRGILVIDPLSNTTDPDTPEAALYDIWNGFRVVANILFFILFLVAILGQSFSGFQVFSAYQIKTIVPRLVIGIIMIQLSWYFAGFIVDVFNVLGAGARHIVLAPIEGFGDVDFDFSNLGAGITIFALTGGLVGAFALAGGFLGLLFLIPMIFLPAILAVIFGIIIMLLRNAGILIAIVISPVAIATWALPNTAGFARFWWGTFWKLLIMYPLIIVLITFGELAARVLVTGNETSIMWNLIAVMALFAPFFLIPYTFRVAQNVLGSLTTGLDGSRKLISERVFGQSWDEGSYAYRARDARFRGRLKRKGDKQYRYLINDRRGWEWNSKGQGDYKGMMFSMKKGNRRVFGIPLSRGQRLGVTPFGFVGRNSKAGIRGIKSKPMGNLGFSRRNNTKLFGRQIIDPATGRKESVTARLGRLAFGRTRARLSAVTDLFPGGMPQDEAMSMRTEAAKNTIKDSKTTVGGKEVVLAIAQTADPTRTQGENVGSNLISGKGIVAEAANEIARHAKDPDEYNARMIALVQQLNNWGQIQTAMNILHDHEWFDPSYLPGVFKGMGFGNQRESRDIKHRVLSLPHLEEVRDPVSGKVTYKVTNDWGAIADNKVKDFLDEINHNISAGENAMYHESAYYGIEEVQQRLKVLAEGYAQGEDRTAMDEYSPGAWSGGIISLIGKPQFKKAVDTAVEAEISAAEAAGRKLTREDVKKIQDDQTKKVREELGAREVAKNLNRLSLWRATMLDELAHARTNLGEEDDDAIQFEEGREVLWRKSDLAVELLRAEKRAANGGRRISEEDIEPHEVEALLADPARQERIMTDVDTYGLKRFDYDGNQITNLDQYQRSQEENIIRDAPDRGKYGGFDKMIEQVIETRWVNDPAYIESLKSGLFANYADILDEARR